MLTLKTSNCINAYRRTKHPHQAKTVLRYCSFKRDVKWFCPEQWMQPNGFSTSHLYIKPHVFICSNWFVILSVLASFCDCNLCDQTDNLKKSSAPHSLNVPLSAYLLHCLDSLILCSGSHTRDSTSDVTSCHKEFSYELLESVHHIVINYYYAKGRRFIFISGNEQFSNNIHETTSYLQCHIKDYAT